MYCFRYLKTRYIALQQYIKNSSWTELLETFTLTAILILLFWYYLVDYNYLQKGVFWETIFIGVKVFKDLLVQFINYVKHEIEILYFYYDFVKFIWAFISPLLKEIITDYIHVFQQSWIYSVLYDYHVIIMFFILVGLWIKVLNDEIKLRPKRYEQKLNYKPTDNRFKFFYFSELWEDRSEFFAMLVAYLTLCYILYILS